MWRISNGAALIPKQIRQKVDKIPGFRGELLVLLVHHCVGPGGRMIEKMAEDGGMSILVNPAGHQFRYKANAHASADEHADGVPIAQLVENIRHKARLAAEIKACLVKALSRF